ncbi:hypothetical protein MMC30_003077 [Trapelia coarctata]|nr:hypothetical protein [Trapelia coarctata]
MITYIENPWETTTRSELVSIGTHSLFLSTSGPPRTNKSPVLIFLTGGGAPVAFYIRLQALLSAFTRVYFYDRSGYNLSEPSPIPHPTAIDAAAELSSLLRAAHVAAPYILVAHSYGGIIAREFLALHPAEEEVVGMVLVDTATELMYDLFSRRIPDPDFAAVAAGIDLAALTHLKEESRLSGEDWQTALTAIARSEAAAGAELSHESGRPLAAKQQFQKQAFGHRPLSVVRCNSARDYQTVYEKGVEMGNGTEAERRGARRFVETWELFDDELREAQCRLSGQKRYVRVGDCGHDVAIRRPEVVVEEVRWVWGRLGS